MRRPIRQKSATMVSASDLTIVAPIRKGLVPALDAVTYKTRALRVLRALHLGRGAAHEYELSRVLSDAVERVGRIHSVRIALLEPEDKLMLAVTFDGSWESYIRLIWQKAARSLDLVFCNTESYLTAWDHSFEDWCTWLRSCQAETPFLYATPGLTYQDTLYLRAYENRLRRDPDVQQADLAAGRFRIPPAEDIADRLRRRGTDLQNLGLDATLDLQLASRAAFRQGLQGLIGLYRLAEVYLPRTADGALLHRATVELLREFVPMVTRSGGAEFQGAIEFAETRFKEALDWLRDTPHIDRPVPTLPEQADDSELGDVQGGMVHAYPAVSHGCLLLLSFDGRSDLADFLESLRPTRATDRLQEGDVAVNLAMSLEGLRLAGLTDEEVAALPEEFVQGMERRAGLLGDVRTNHPRRWRLPAHNAALGVKAADIAEGDPAPRVELRGVHAVLQLRLCNTSLAETDARDRMWQRYGDLAERHSGLRLLSIQWMHSLKTPDGREREHFGYLHSDFAPGFAAAERGRKYPNQAHLGEVLLGYDTAADFARPPHARTATDRLLRNGSFMVIRKLRQDVAALERALVAAVDEALPLDESAGRKEQRARYRERLMAKMMGRWPAESRAQAGLPLANATADAPDDFTYLSDREGTRCPFHAHIRLANPREVSGATFSPPGARPPRIVRRGMSYGPAHHGEDEPAQERGLVFIAYNASLGEQFEVIQGWLTKGNGSGGYSAEGDPFLGVPQAGRPRYFRFEHEGAVVRMRLDGSERTDEEPRPIVRLEWGLYTFVPSLSCLRQLAGRAREAAASPPLSWSVERGEAEIERLRGLERDQGEAAAFEAWKAALEDPSAAADFQSASLWAAIRDRHEGVLRTPFGVLVASRARVQDVLLDRDRNLTATGYLPRMERSFGALYLGLDAGQTDGRYERESASINAAIMALTGDRARFEAAVAESAAATDRAIARLVQLAKEQAREEGEHRWSVTIDAGELVDAVLAHFCELWFGLSERGGHFARSGLRWNWKVGEPACYPGHFMAPSRYTFQPHPGSDVERIAGEHAASARTAMDAYLRELGAGLQAPVARAVLDCEAAAADATYATRTLCGVLMGFLPTTDGNLRRVLLEWLTDGTFAGLRARFAGADTATMAREVRSKFIQAMQLRAAPELLWRKAVKTHALGPITVRPGDIVVASLLSSTQESLAKGEPDVDHAFGGQRGAADAHPVHACPGQGPAMAVMLGFFTGLVQTEQPLRTGPAPLTLALEGRL